MGLKFDLLVAMNDAILEERWDDVGAILHPELTAWSPTYNLESSDAWVAALQQQNSGLEDIQTRLRFVAETDDVVVYEAEWSIPNPARSGRAVLHSISVFEFDGDKVRALRQYWDSKSFYDQLTPSSTPAGHDG